MNWLKNIVCKWVRDDWNAQAKVNQAYPEAVCVEEYDEVDLDHGFKFTVMPAQGGTIIQLRSYDRKTDRRKYSTHVISDSDDIATSVGHIVSMEILRGDISDR